MLLAATASIPLRDKPRPPAKATPQGFEAQIREKTELSYRHKIYAPLIEAYKKMLQKMPDNLDLKKKLAFAYFGAGDYKNAEPLLNEVAKTDLADDETRRELEYIKNLK